MSQYEMAVNHNSEIQIFLFNVDKTSEKVDLALQEMNFMEIYIFKEPEDLTIKYHI